MRFHKLCFGEGVCFLLVIDIEKEMEKTKEKKKKMEKELLGKLKPFWLWKPCEFCELGDGVHLFLTTNKEIKRWCLFSSCIRNRERDT
jgi:hypothetical protein